MVGRLALAPPDVYVGGVSVIDTKSWMALLSAAALLCASPALANGRFPRALRLVESPTDADKLVVVGTYGLLVTEDRGRHWYHVCDPAFTFEAGFGSDPVFGLTGDGSFLVGAQTRMTRSNDRGCDWVKVLEPAKSSVDDFTMLPSNPNDILAVVTEYQTDSTIVRLQESSDGGLTWKPVGAPLPAAFIYTVDVDPKDPAHIYATASSNSADETAPCFLLTTHDRGTTWDVRAIPSTNINATPWIAAVHPKDGNKLFVRTDGWKNRDVIDAADDALLYSDDGGATWTELLHAAAGNQEVPGAKLLGFALSPDGSTVLAGYGNPMDPARLADPDGTWGGIYQSSSDGRFSFGAEASAISLPLVPGNVNCLTWTARGVYACFSPIGRVPYVAFAPDPSFASSSMTTLMQTDKTLGAPPCCGGRAVNACTWAVDCQPLQACDAGPPPSPPNCGGAGGKGGASTTDAGPSVGAGGMGSETPPGTSKGCGCRLGARRTHDALTVLLLVAALAMGSGRLRGRSSRSRRRCRRRRPHLDRTSDAGASGSPRRRRRCGS